MTNPSPEMMQTIEQWNDRYGPGSGYRCIPSAAGGRILYHPETGDSLHFMRWGVNGSATLRNLPSASGIAYRLPYGRVAHEYRRAQNGSTVGTCAHCGVRMSESRLAWGTTVPASHPKCSRWRSA